MAHRRAAAATPNGGWAITWEKFREGRCAKNISAQIEFFPNDDFITRSNNVECVYRRVNPDDWDDDGIANEEDDEPMIAADETKFGSSQTLPDGANSNAYYWVDLVVPRANAKVSFVGDGASNLTDPSFIAKAGETNRVTLLIGKSYRATCAFPFTIAAKSSDEIEESWNGENEVELCWPVSISVVSDGDAASDAQAAAVRQMQIVDPNNGTLLATPLLASAATTEAAAASVSFSQIAIEEVPNDGGSTVGYFTHSDFRDWWHHNEKTGAGNWLDVSVQNKIGVDYPRIEGELYRMMDNGLLVDDPSYGWRYGELNWEDPFGWNERGTANGEAEYKRFAVDEEQNMVILETGRTGVRKLKNAVTRDIDGTVYLNGKKVR